MREELRKNSNLTSHIPANVRFERQTKKHTAPPSDRWVLGYGCVATTHGRFCVFGVGGFLGLLVVWLFGFSGFLVFVFFGFGGFLGLLVVWFFVFFVFSFCFLFGGLFGLLVVWLFGFWVFGFWAFWIWWILGVVGCLVFVGVLVFGFCGFGGFTSLVLPFLGRNKGLIWDPSVCKMQNPIHEF